MKSKLLLILLLVTFEALNQKHSAQLDSLDSTYSKMDDSLLITDNIVQDFALSPSDSTENAEAKMMVKTGSCETNSDLWKYILPILTLLLGIFINRGIDYRSEKKKIKKAGERWVAEIRCLETPLLKQVEELEKFQESMATISFEIPRVTVFSILNCDIFKSLDKSELLKFIEYSTKQKFLECVRISNRTNGFITVTASIQEALKEKFNSFLKESSSLVSSFSKNLNALCLAFADYGVEIEKEISKDPLSDTRFAPIAKLFKDHIFSKSKDGNYNVPELEDSFFQPLITELSKVRLDNRTKELGQIASRCRTDIQGIRMEREYMKENTKKVIELYSRQHSELPEVIKELEPKNISKK
jgi:hypothetical protein